MWTVNDTESMERLVGLGVDGIISDVPTTLCEVLPPGVAWDGVRAAGPAGRVSHARSSASCRGWPSSSP